MLDREGHRSTGHRYAGHVRVPSTVTMARQPLGGHRPRWRRLGPDEHDADRRDADPASKGLEQTREVPAREGAPAGWSRDDAGRSIDLIGTSRSRSSPASLVPPASTLSMLLSPWSRSGRPGRSVGHDIDRTADPPWIGWRTVAVTMDCGWRFSVRGGRCRGTAGSGKWEWLKPRLQLQADPTVGETLAATGRSSRPTTFWCSWRPRAASPRCGAVRTSGSSRVWLYQVPRATSVHGASRSERRRGPPRLSPPARRSP